MIMINSYYNLYYYFLGVFIPLIRIIFFQLESNFLKQKLTSNFLILYFQSGRKYKVNYHLLVSIKTSYTVKHPL